MIANQFLAGSKAKITGAYQVIENIGKAVELVQFVKPQEDAFYRDGYFEGGQSGVWIVKGEGLLRKFVDDTSREDTICAVALEHLHVEASGLHKRTKSA
jgi:hypothetical protein